MNHVKTVLRFLLALLFTGAGINHFINPVFYLRMMPPYLPWHGALVAISGVAEIAIGLGLLIPRTVRLSAWAAIALLVAVFPANVQMALHPETFPEFSPTALLVRLPLQGVLIVWAFWFTRRNSRGA